MVSVRGNRRGTGPTRALYKTGGTRKRASVLTGAGFKKMNEEPRGVDLDEKRKNLTASGRQIAY